MHAACGRDRRASALTLALARAWSRRRGWAVQSALGASPSRLFAQILLERLILAGCGSAAGLLIGLASVGMLQSRLAALVPGLDDIPVHPAIVILLVTSAGALAMLETVVLYFRCRPLEQGLLRGDGQGSLDETRPLRTYGIIGLQVALSVVLMAVGLETSRQVFAFRHLDRGYRPEQLVVARFIPEHTNGFLARRAYQDTMLRTVSEPLWARSAALVSAAPFAGETWSTDVVTAASDSGASGVSAAYSVVSDTFFDVLGTPLVDGRRFDDRDNFSEAQAAEPDKQVESVLINRSLALRLVGTASAAGRAIRRGQRHAIVVGVVEDTRLFPGHAQAGPEIFGTFRQHNGPYHLTLVARTAPWHSPLPLYRMLRATLPTVGFFNVETASGIIDAAIPLQHVSSLLIQLFAGVAVAVALASLGALVTLVVRSSRRSLAIRLVLGARPRDVIGVIGRQAAWSLGIGGAAGLAAATGLGRWLTASGYWPESPSILILSAGTILLMTVEAFAILVPGREAIRIDPINTLRTS